MTTSFEGINDFSNLIYTQWKNQYNKSVATDNTSYTTFNEGTEVLTDEYVKESEFTCTDGNDDGNLSIGETVGCFFKGVVGKVKEQVSNLVETVKEHPVKTAAIVAGTTAAAVAATALLGPVAIVGMGVIGLGTAVYNGAKAVGGIAESYKEAKNAETDAEAKEAIYNMGGSTTEVVENVGLGVLSATQINSGLNALKSTGLATVAENVDDAARLTGETVIENADDVARLTGETVAETAASSIDDAAEAAAKAAAEAAEDVLNSGVSSRKEILNAIKLVHPDMWESAEISEETFALLQELTQRLNSLRSVAAAA